MKKLLFTVGLLLSAGLAAQPVLADTFVRTGSQYELPQGQQIQGNFLGVGHPISLSGEVMADATVLGNRVNVSGTVGEDLLAVGVLSTIDGVVEGDVRILSGNTTISGVVNGDVLIVGGSAEVLSGAVVRGDLLLYAGTADVAGTVGGDVIGSVQQLTIDGGVSGAVDVVVQNLVLGNTASVTESVRYASSNLLSQSLNSYVGGTIIRNDPPFSSGGFSLQSVVLPFLIFIFSTLTWLFLSRKTLTQVVTKTVYNIPRSAITGIVAFLILPLVSFVLFLSVLGGFLALVLLSGYIFTLLLAVVALPAVIGFLCLQVTRMKSAPVTVMSILVGSVVSGVLLLLPHIGLFVLVFLTVLVFGGLIEALIRASR